MQVQVSTEFATEKVFSYIVFEAPKVLVLAATQTLKIEKNFEHKNLSLELQKIKINVIKSSKVVFKQKIWLWQFKSPRLRAVNDFNIVTLKYRNS